jgi:hypothetical protein
MKGEKKKVCKRDYAQEKKMIAIYTNRSARGNGMIYRKARQLAVLQSPKPDPKVRPMQAPQLRFVFLERARHSFSCMI